MVKATFVKDVSEDFRGTAQLYRLSEPVPHHLGETEYVVVSAALSPFTGPETYIFASDEDGNVVCWTEMRGSFRGAMDIPEAIYNAGWEIA